MELRDFWRRFTRTGMVFGVLGALGLLSCLPALFIAYVVCAALPGRVWTAWPLLVMPALPVLVAVAVTSCFRWLERRSSSDAPKETRPIVEWLCDRLSPDTELGVWMITLSKDDERSGYRAGPRVIALGDDLLNSTSAAAYAIAAHELGHALIHARTPWLFRIALWCRPMGDFCFKWGWLLLIAMVATGVVISLPLAQLFVAMAAATHALVAVDEAIASKLAMRELRAAGLDARQRWLARRYLLFAFISYAGHAVLAVAALMTWPQLEAWIGDGSFTPGPLMNNRLALFTTFAAAAAVVSAFWFFIKSDGEKALREMLSATCVATTTALFLNLFDQPIVAEAPWELVMAAVLAFDMVTLPLSVVVLLIPLLAAGRDHLIHRIGPDVRSSLLESTSTETPWHRGLRVAYCMLGFPLALLYLESLFGR